jgi:hypothetical protein
LFADLFFCFIFQTPPQASAAEKAALDAHATVNLKALPVRSYLDQTVSPILLAGMTQMVKERCV